MVSILFVFILFLNCNSSGFAYGCLCKQFLTNLESCTQKKNLHVFFSRKFVGCVTSGTFKKQRFAIEFSLGYVDHIHCFIPLKYDTILTVELSNYNEVGFKPCKLLINFFSTIVICCIIPGKHKVDLVLYCGENLIEIDYPHRHIQYIMAMKKYIIV